MTATPDEVALTRDEYDRRIEEAVRTWESLADSPELLDLNDTVVASDADDDTVPWPTRPTPATPPPGCAEALQVLPDAVVLFGPDGAVKFWNAAAESLFGWAAMEVVGKPAPFVSAAQMPEHVEILAAARRDTPIRERVVSRRGKDGQNRTLNLFTTPTNAGDAMMMFRAVEAKPEPPKEAASPKFEAMGRMLASVSHDFNNVLSAIVGSADLLADRIAIFHPDREWVEVIRTAGRHATGLTRRLIQFAKPSPVTPSHTDLSEVVESLLPLVKALVPTGVRLRTHLEPNLPTTAVEPTAVEQILLNLATNAGQAMPRGGSLQIRTTTALRDGRPFVVLAVADTGQGMDDAVRARLFEPFHTTKAAGTGLGLATVRDIVHQARGDIEVESHPGLGSVFRVFLPAQTASLPLLPGRTAMVVDDDPSVREVMKRVLESAGYDALEAASGEEAVHVLRWESTELDLLVTDVVMPSLGGRKLVEQLRTTQPDLAVVYVSGYPPVCAEPQPNTSFLAKPFNGKQLLAAVRAVMPMTVAQP